MEGISQERASQCSTLPEDIDQDETDEVDGSVVDGAVIWCGVAMLKGWPVQMQVLVQVPDAMPSLEVGRPKKGSWLWSVWCWAKPNLVLPTWVLVALLYSTIRPSCGLALWSQR